VQTLRIGQGYTASWTVTLRYARDHPESPGAPVEGVYSGSEPLEVALDDGAGGEATLSASAAAWLDASAGTIALTLDDADTAALGPARLGLSIRLDDGGEPVEVYRALLLVEGRP
jgi:hypothetical protein